MRKPRCTHDLISRGRRADDFARLHLRARVCNSATTLTLATRPEAAGSSADSPGLDHADHRYVQSISLLGGENVSEGQKSSIPLLSGHQHIPLAQNLCTEPHIG